MLVLFRGHIELYTEVWGGGGGVAYATDLRSRSKDAKAKSWQVLGYSTKVYLQQLLPYDSQRTTAGAAAAPYMYKASTAAGLPGASLILYQKAQEFMMSQRLCRFTVTFIRDGAIAPMHVDNYNAMELFHVPGKSWVATNMAIVTSPTGVVTSLP